LQSENPNKNTSQHIFEQIKIYFENKPEVAAVYIFGSKAKGTEREKSDIDLAVLIDNDLLNKQFDLKNTYIKDLSRILRKDLDILIMNELGESILSQIFKYGQCIVNQKPQVLSEFKMVSIAMIAEFEYYRKITEKGFLRRIVEGNSDR